MKKRKYQNIKCFGIFYILNPEYSNKNFKNQGGIRMQIAGIVGGLGPESTVDYYQSIIKGYQDAVGEAETLPHFVIYSINMYQVFRYIEAGDLEGLTDYLVSAVRHLEAAGADFAIISANTPHIVFEAVERKTKIPLYSIVLETLAVAQEMHVKKILLLGTKFTMEDDFFKKPFVEAGIEIIVPTETEQRALHEKIVSELEKGIVKENTKAEFLEVIDRIEKEDHIQGLVLGCTELPMILQAENTEIPQFNTTQIHVDKVVSEILK